MITPYYQDNRITLYHGDCLEIRAWLDADVLVTDPPYGIAYSCNYRYAKAKGREAAAKPIAAPIAGDSDTTQRDSALSVWGTRPAIIFGRWDQPRPIATHTRLIWDKGGGFLGDLSNPWGKSDEEIYVLGRGFSGKREGSVVRIHLNSQAADRPNHPTPKPIPLMERLIDKCPPGTIADPFAGSGATLIAARNLGRKAIGVELEERYCEIIARRLDQMCLDFGEGA